MEVLTGPMVGPTGIQKPQLINSAFFTNTPGSLAKCGVFRFVEVWFVHIPKLPGSNIAELQIREEVISRASDPPEPEELFPQMAN